MQGIEIFEVALLTYIACVSICIAWLEASRLMHENEVLNEMFDNLVEKHERN